MIFCPKWIKLGSRWLRALSCDCLQGYPRSPSNPSCAVLRRAPPPPLESATRFSTVITTHRWPTSIYRNDPTRPSVLSQIGNTFSFFSAVWSVCRGCASCFCCLSIIAVILLLYGLPSEPCLPLLFAWYWFVSVLCFVVWFLPGSSILSFLCSTNFLDPFSKREYIVISLLLSSKAFWLE
jgi:hypothetical protein